MKKKFVFFTNDTSQFLSHRGHLLKILYNLNFQTYIFAPKYNDVFKKFHVRHIKYDIGRKKSFVLFELIKFLKFFFILRNINPNFIQAIAIKPTLFSIIFSKLNKKTKLISNITGLGYIFNNQNNFLLQKIVLFILKYFKEEKNFFIFQNNFEKNFFIKKKLCKNYQTKIIEGSPINKIYKKKNIEKKINIICVSRMLYDKGIIDFIYSAKEILKHGYKFNFLLVGPIDKKNKSSINKNYLLKINKTFKKIKWVGKKSNLKKIFNEAMLMCFPSYHEGSPRALIEAASNGLPIICYDIPGCRTIVKNEYNGILVKVKNKKLLTKKLIEIIQNKKKLNIYSNNSIKMSKKFLIQNFNKNYIKFYSRFCGV